MGRQKHNSFLSIDYKDVNLLPLLFAGLSLFSMVVFVNSISKKYQVKDHKFRVENELSLVAARLEGNVTKNIVQIESLVAAIQEDPQLSEDKYHVLGQAMIQSSTEVINIAAAPDLIVSYIWPVQGNESVLGVDYRNVPEQLEKIIKVKETQKLLITGPVDLIQGGKGLIIRVPVFLKKSEDEDRFWGVVSSVIDIQKLFLISGLENLDADLVFGVRTLEDNPNIKHHVYGDIEVFNDDAIIKKIELPGVEWQLVAYPLGGWQHTSIESNLLKVTMIVTAFLVLLLLYVLSTILIRNKKTKNDLLAILEHSPAAIFIKDVRSRYLYVNSKFENITGVKASRIIGKSDHDFIENDQANEFLRFDQRVIQFGKEFEFDQEIYKDGKTKNYTTIKFPLFGKEGDLYAICGIATDVTERLKTEKSLRRSQKMEALGNLTSGVAHDFNNILGVIIGYSELLASSLKHQPKLTEFAQEIHHAGKRGAGLTKKLLDFSRVNNAGMRAANINQAIKSQKLILEKTLTSRIQLEFELEENVWSLKFDVDEFLDAILNLSINSMHSITGNGVIFIRTSNMEHYNFDSDKLPLNDGEYVMFEIEDTGCGIKSSIKDKIFDPFFTTKGDDGSGLGLAQVYGFVKRSGGVITVDSEIEKGTSIKIYFPRFKELEFQE